MKDSTREMVYVLLEELFTMEPGDERDLFITDMVDKVNKQIAADDPRKRPKTAIKAANGKGDGITTLPR